MSVLNVSDLSVKYTTRSGRLRAVNQVSFTIEQGTTLGIVGESGSGKSQLAMAIMGLLDDQARVSGKVLFEGQSLLELSNSQRRNINGNQIAMVFQDPMSSLNPYLSIATQMTEVLVTHKRINYKTALRLAIKLLIDCGISDAEQRIHSYPHQFSGGMRQRILIATALLCQPSLLIADEPTTALDVSMQAQILSLIKQLQRQQGITLMVITHDFGVVAELCDQVMVLYGGQVMEYGQVSTVLQQPKHPYTQGLLASMPTLKKTGQQLYSMPGDPPDPVDLPRGCPFEPRCSKRILECQSTKSEQVLLKDGRQVFCHIVDNFRQV
ncbi:MAG: ABC transporter ATP-binding protein [Methylococcales bacterium]